MIIITRQDEIHPSKPNVTLHKSYRAEIPWADMTAILGHDHRGVRKDDTTLINYLLQYCDAPEWVKDATGYTDASCWILEGSAW